MSSILSATTAKAATSADFTLLSAHAKELAAQLNVEIVGNAAGFNILHDGAIISLDSNPTEIERWLQGCLCGIDLASDAQPDFVSSAQTPDAKDLAIGLATANGCGWRLEVSGEDITVIGRKFKETVTGWPAFLVFIKGFESSCYTHDLMFESIKQFEAGVPAAGTNGGAA